MSSFKNRWESSLVVFFIYFFLIFQYESFFESKNESTKAIVVKSCKMF